MSVELVFQTLLVSTFVLGMIAAAISDIKTMLIPNWISAGIALLFLPAAIIAGADYVMIGQHLVAGLIVFIACAVLFAFGLFGGGDVKLAAAGAIWAGLDWLMIYTFVIVLLGGLLCLMVLVARRLPMAEAMEGLPWMRQGEKGDPGVPYGVAIAIGCLWLAPKFFVVEAVLNAYT